ncbi:hypothetical protein DIC66_22045 [Rhodoferax lacus]|uniref:Permuted papain-like amidase YaeF/Yiix C92 family enzyme n=1 Tax=Rhodoferax lacus TaxID=2184758 RepID=A0A3E1R5Z1_9BURK|nr:hypothetical protein [Rhodoferax lacus]RFO94707.1 hypothetical protein DIC66_22045 [Rhodoferax lacus]
MKAKLEMVVLVGVSWLVKVLFLLYRAAPFCVPFAGVFYVLDGWLFAGQSPAYAGSATGVAALAAALVTQRHPAKDNPYRAYLGWSGWLEKRVDGLIAWIGTIKYFTSPLGLVEDPGSYRISGDEVRALVDGVLQPGDILLRGFDGYLDGVLIKLTSAKSGPGSGYSHAALFLGDLNDTSDRAIAARRLEVLNPQGQWVAATDQEMNAVRENRRYFAAGRQRVVHAMTRGVFTEDILTFLRCDYLAVLRLPETLQLTPQELARKTDRSLIQNLHQDAAAIRQALLRGDTVQAPDVLEAVRLSALGKIGSCYDFQFNDAKTHQRFSCSEFVYYCLKSIHCYIGLELKDHGLFGAFLVRQTITPSDIYEAAVKHGKLAVVWQKA